MALKSIHSFLVHPGKGAETPSAIKGTRVRLSGPLTPILSKIFDNAEKDCEHEIAFSLGNGGQSQNDCRDLVVDYAIKGSIESARRIARRLQDFRGARSKIGLLFVMHGVQARTAKVVISRFPADSGIMADEAGASLTVKYLEKVFMKNAAAYKAAVYSGSSVSKDFWDGRAIDHQINHAVIDISNYWIKEFLASGYKATDAQGTKEPPINNFPICHARVSRGAV